MSRMIFPKRLGSLRVVVLTAIGGLCLEAQAQGNIISLEVPEMLAAKPITMWSKVERDEIDERIQKQLALWTQSQLLSDEEKEKLDAIIIFTQNGKFLLPDREQALRQRGERPQHLANELTFTFNSPNHPWTVAELDSLQKWLGDFYSAAKAIYGNPAFNISVNVKKDSTISLAGLYSASSNEMTIRLSSRERLADRQDVIVHEMIHAFRDDYIIGLNCYEEGMARSAEVEVLNQLQQYPRYWNTNHSYTYDVFYDALNEPGIASKNGNFLGATGLRVLRYQLSGYAWAKAYLENALFFVNFNQAYYAQMLFDPTTQFDAAKLKNLVASFTPAVEQKGFEVWYDQQHVLNVNPDGGYILYQRTNQYSLDYFFRDAVLGTENSQAGAAVQWTVYGFNNALLDSGSVITNFLGTAFFDPRLQGYFGKIKIVVATTTPDGPVQEISYRPYYFGTLSEDELGVFGVIPEQTHGIVTLRSLDEPSASATQALINGAFYFPQFEKIRGRFELIYTAPDSQQFQRIFTKDASHYFIGSVEPRVAVCSSNGDVNGDGVLTPGDALCAFRIYLNNGKLPSDCDALNSLCELAAADVNCDGTITPGDALAIFMRYLNGLPPQNCFAAAHSSIPTVSH